MAERKAASPSPGVVPAARVGLIGGSATFSLDFPGRLETEDCRVVQDKLVFETPFGRSPAFKLLKVRTRSGIVEALACRMHGWRRGVKRGSASLQVFWVFSKAGVEKIVSDGGVGSLNPLLDPRDVLVPTDYVDLTVRKDIYVRGDHLLVMRQPVCPTIHAALTASAERRFSRVFPRGVYVVTEGPQFESPAEVRMLQRVGGDIVGQSFAPEVVLARDIGACFAGLYIVANYGEGVVKDWEHPELAAIFHDEATRMGEAIVDALARLDLDAPCPCQDLRHPTLLRDDRTAWGEAEVTE